MVRRDEPEEETDPGERREEVARDPRDADPRERQERVEDEDEREAEVGRPLGEAGQEVERRRRAREVLAGERGQGAEPDLGGPECD